MRCSINERKFVPFLQSFLKTNFKISLFAFKDLKFVSLSFLFHKKIYFGFGFGFGIGMQHLLASVTSLPKPKLPKFWFRAKFIFRLFITHN